MSPRPATWCVFLVVASLLAAPPSTSLSAGPTAEPVSPVRSPVWLDVQRNSARARDVIYPPQTIPLAFGHRQHLEKTALGCLDCHPTIPTSIRTSELNLPPESVCFGCHDVDAPDPAEASPPATCGTCHQSPDGTHRYRPLFDPSSETSWGPPSRKETFRASPPPPRIHMPAAALRFGHRTHHERGTPCVRCHPGVETTGLATVADLPLMSVCLECHNGRRASGRCEVCHLTGADGRMLTDLPGGRLVPNGRFRDDDHHGRFTQQHGRAAAADPDYCQSCHRDDDCHRCHTGALRPVEIHPADFILTHPPSARRDDPSCGTCHRSQSFCVDCHERSGLTDRRGRFQFGAGANQGHRFHPDGWVDYLGRSAEARHHRHEARRNLRVCVGCHREETCVRCHAVDATPSLRASPHPPGFAQRCRQTRGRNQRGCLKCHRSDRDLDRICGP